MKRAIKRFIDKLHNDNRGSAIVLVIIALAMVGILGITIMWMSMTNYYMKATDKGNKQGFYTSESVFEQIKAGLEEDASKAASKAYAYILTREYSTGSLTDRDYEFRQRFQKYFAAEVSDPSNAYKYSLVHLQTFLDPSMGVELTKQTSGRIRYLGSNSAEKLSYEPSNSVIKFEGLHLEYTDVDPTGNEYVSIIDTDIIVTVPDIKFTQTSPLPDVFEYALVADKKFEVANGSDTIVNGSIYAGDDGIKMLDSLTVQKAGHLISKGDVKVGKTDPTDTSAANTKLEIIGRNTGNATEFWANDITLGSGFTELNANKVNTYVADDLTLMGNKAKAVMDGNGKYIGYGISDSHASESSAVVVNGLGSSVDVKGLSEFTLLGRTFVSIAHETIDPYTLTLSSDTVDITMGESIAVKGEQVAFLVPDDCLSITVSGNTVGMANPFVKSDYNQTELASINVDLTDLAIYGVAPGGYKKVYPYGSQLGYIYVDISGDQASQYYEDYYRNNLDKMNTYFKVYTGGSIEVPTGTTTTEADFITSAGGYTTPLSGNIITNTDSQLNMAVKSADKDSVNNLCVTTKQNLCAKLLKEGVTPAELGNELFDNLIRRDEVEDLISRNHNISGTGWNGYRFEVSGTGTSSDGKKAVFVKASESSPGTYVLNDPNVRVLIVIGDVDVNTDFTGLLISSGKVTVKNGHRVITSIVNDEAKLQELKDSLQFKCAINYEDPNSHTVVSEDRNAIRYFVDGSEYDLDGLTQSSTSVSNNKVKFTELVLFNNWVKK
ncbi:MAG: hypothetical protein K6F34_02320 [Lachnospiraceae bacterium]|nr:hypothetical protein [Lachnospiraceae bacterium]